MVYRGLVGESDTLRPEDRELLLALLELITARRRKALAQGIRDYYRDGDRSDRTPRQIMYMHLGILSAHLGAK
jgi:hypothetical protein